MIKLSDGNAAPDGLQQLKSMINGGLRAPLGEKLGFALVEVERGTAILEGKPDRTHYNPIGSVHGGYAAALLDSACGLSVHSTLGPNRGHTTLELKISYIRALTDKSGLVRATGRVVSVGRRVGYAEATLHDGDGKLCCTATSTLLVFDVEPKESGSIQS